MTDKKRLPRFDDIVARSHRPPVRRPDSLFAAAYDAEEARKKAGLTKITVDDFSALPEAPSIDTNPDVDTNLPVDAKTPQVDTKVDTNPAKVDTKVATLPLTPILGLTPTAALTPTHGLTPKKKQPPSWRMSRLSVRLDKEKLDRLHFVAMSRGITLQDLIGGWADAFLADEGLTPMRRLTPTGGWHQTDQMIDDVGCTSTSSVLERPEELLAYYAKWTGNQIRENDWQAMRVALSYAPTAIKAGILMSILRTKTKVNSFKYCLGAIDEVAKAGIVGSTDHVRYLEMKVEKAREGK
jgi:hypothetical protein